MKKSNTLIGIFIIFSLSFLVAASGANAESQKEAPKSLAAVLNLKATSLMELITPPPAEAASENKPPKQVSIALNRELDAFVDFKSPYPEEIRTKNTRDDVRAVIGFHFLLK